MAKRVVEGGANRFRQYLESAKDSSTYILRGYALEALAHSNIPNIRTFGALEAWRLGGCFIASQQVVQRVWQDYLRWIAENEPDPVDVAAPDEGGR